MSNIWKTRDTVNYTKVDLSIIENPSSMDSAEILPTSLFQTGPLDLISTIQDAHSTQNTITYSTLPW